MPWKVPNMWKNGECWIIGGGPSLPRQFDVPETVIQDVLSGRSPVSVYSPYFSAIHAKHSIGINQAFRIGDWMDMVFFGDRKFYLTNRFDLGNFPGLKVTSSTNVTAHCAKEENIKVTPRDGNHPKGISMRPGFVAWNNNSGAAAISVAAQAGATRIVLVGFDMSLGANNALHWHKLYPKMDIVSQVPKVLPFAKHLEGFAHIKEDADRLGIEIINASPDSKIEEFRKVSVKELL